MWKCAKKSYYTSQCKSKTTAADGTNEAVTFGFYGIHSSWAFPNSDLLPSSILASPLPTSNRFDTLSNLTESSGTQITQPPQVTSPTMRQRSSTTANPTTTYPKRNKYKWSTLLQGLLSLTLC